MFFSIFSVRKVVGQLKSDADVAKKPVTWAKAVQGPQNTTSELLPVEPPQPPPPLANEDYCDKENVRPDHEETEQIPSSDQVKEVDQDDVGQSEEAVDPRQSSEIANDTNDNLENENVDKEAEIKDGPVWILPPETDPKPKRRKKGKKRPSKIE